MSCCRSRRWAHHTAQVAASVLLGAPCCGRYVPSSTDCPCLPHRHGCGLSATASSLPWTPPDDPSAPVTTEACSRAPVPSQETISGMA